jgi:hypothetical protein
MRLRHQFGYLEMYRRAIYLLSGPADESSSAEVTAGLRAREAVDSVPELADQLAELDAQLAATVATPMGTWWQDAMRYFGTDTGLDKATWWPEVLR